MGDVSAAKNDNDTPTNEVLSFSFLMKEIFSTAMPKTQELLAREGYINKKPIYLLFLILDVILRGISQVFLCNHPISGIFVCIGLAFTSFELLGFAVLGTAVSTFTATVIARPPKDNVLAGLCGYDGALVGCACWAFLDKSCSIQAAWMLSALCGIVHVACENILKVWSLPCFTFAFNIVTIMILFAINAGIVNMRFAPATAPDHGDSWNKMSIMFAVDASIRGVGQFMFADTTIGSAFVIAGIAVSSRKGAAVATLGSIIGWLTAFYILSVANVAAVRSGLHGYNCAGTCSALAGGIFYKASDSAVLVGVFGAFLAALINVGILGAFGGSLPSLTFPFILSAWLIMLSRTKWLTKTTDSGGSIIRPFLRKLSSKASLDDEKTTAERPEMARVNSSGSVQGLKSLDNFIDRTRDELESAKMRPTHGSPEGAAQSRTAPPRRGLTRQESYLGRQVDVLTRNMQFERVEVPFLDYYPSLPSMPSTLSNMSFIRNRSNTTMTGGGPDAADGGTPPSTARARNALEAPEGSHESMEKLNYSNHYPMFRNLYFRVPPVFTKSQESPGSTQRKRSTSSESPSKRSPRTPPAAAAARAERLDSPDMESGLEMSETPLLGHSRHDEYDAVGTEDEEEEKAAQERAEEAVMVMGGRFSSAAGAAGAAGDVVEDIEVGLMTHSSGNDQQRDSPASGDDYN